MNLLQGYRTIPGGYILMFEYENNDQLKNELKKIVIDCGTTNKAIADKLEITPQTYQHLINKKQFSFSDMKRIADAAGFKLMIDFVPVQSKEK